MPGHITRVKQPVNINRVLFVDPSRMADGAAGDGRADHPYAGCHRDRLFNIVHEPADHTAARAANLQLKSTGLKSKSRGSPRPSPKAER
jgi:hypothetical protein